MKVSKETLVVLVCQELSSCKYCFRSLILGAIQMVKEKTGYTCDASDVEVCDTVVATMRRLYESEKPTLFSGI